jgi:hypothetical protein
MLHLTVSSDVSSILDIVDCNSVLAAPPSGYFLAGVRDLLEHVSVYVIADKNEPYE